MKKLIIITSLLFSFAAAAFPEGYRNPVIPGFYPDPSVCRVGDDYYLVTSTFQYFPGVPVFHSRDLVNWRQIGHCLTRESQLNLKDTYPSGGIFAPTIRYHEGTFYMITTNVSDKGNFIVYTDNPAGEWSEPVWLQQGGIDPSLYFEDGRCYMTSIPGGPITLCEVNPKTGEQLTESRAIWYGTGGRYPEAPHIYKKDGWYYLLIAEGGTEYAHKITIARSRDIYGPYESNPANPILTHMNRNAQSNPIQALGHGDIVEAHDGSWWMVCLGFRPQSGLHHMLGRETFLAPVTWEKNAWPVVNGDGTINLEMNISTLPQVQVSQKPLRDEFDTDNPGLEWNWLYNPVMKNYSFTDRPGYLRMKPTDIDIDDRGAPTFMGRRQQHVNCVATTSVELTNPSVGDAAGITVYMTHEFNYNLYVKRVDKGKQAVVLRYRLGNMSHVEKEVLIPEGICYLQVRADNDFYNFYYSTDNNRFHEMGKMDVKFISTETAGGFTGIYFGLYATCVGTTKGRADFDWFEYSRVD